MRSVLRQPIAQILDRREAGTIAQVFWVVMFAALTAVGARIEVPHEPVPYTMQTFFVLLGGAFLGPRNGAISQVVYLAIGALGVPVFASAGFGLGRLFGPTGGYLLAFPAAAAIVGYLVERHRSRPWIFFSMAMGLLVIFACGTIQLYAKAIHDWVAAFNSGFLIFSWWDAVKLGAAAMGYHEAAKRWPRIP